MEGGGGGGEEEEGFVHKFQIPVLMSQAQYGQGDKVYLPDQNEIQSFFNA